MLTETTPLTLREILNRREAIRTELRAINDAHPDAALPAEVETRAAALEAEAVQLNAAERRAVVLDEMDRRATGVPIGTGDANFDKLAAQVTFLDTVRAQLPGATDEASGRAREVSQEIERRSGRKAEGLYFSMERPAAETRVQTTSVDSAGGFLVAEEVRPVIDRLRQRLIVKNLGATVLSGLVGDLSIPRLDASASAQWIGDNQALTASNLTFGAVGLNARHVGGIIEISRGMLLQASQDVSALATNDLTKILAVALDTAAINGSGTNAQPLGLLNNPDVTASYVAGGNGGDPSWNAIIAAAGALDSANVDMSQIAFATNAKVVSKLRRTLKTTADTASNFIMTEPSSLAGYPLASSQIVPSNLVRGSSGAVCSALIVGDWQQLLIGMWSGVDILVNPFASGSYEKGNVQVRCMMTCDINVRHPEAFVILPDLTTT